MLTIETIIPESAAHQAGLRAGDQILSINGEALRDMLDFEFFRGEGVMEIELLRGKRHKMILIQRQHGLQLGIEPESMRVKICRNKCIFCFVSQMPKGLRRSLYVKDEDFRYSFLNGCFTTLSNMKEADWERVVSQQLSPLYVSVHATEPGLRGRLLGNDRLEPIMGRLSWLKEHGISFHTQLVILPGWNDKVHLETSLEQLISLYPAVLSISVVPVGITGHRVRLPDLKPFTRAIAQDTLNRMQKISRKCRRRYGQNVIYPSDEILVLAGHRIPPGSYYGDYSQYQNGVGMLRALLDDFAVELPGLPRAAAGWGVTILTAPLAVGVINRIMRVLKREKGLQAEIIICVNHTFGASVTVTGLLAGADFALALESSKFKGTVLIPPNSVNEHGLFLDDMAPAQLESHFGRKMVVARSFSNYFP